MRFGLFLASALLAVAVTSARSSAASEFCPAAVDSIQQVGGSSSTVYSVVLDARGPRSVAGTIVVRDGVDWYRVTFPASDLTAVTEHFADDYREYSSTAYQSAPLYVRFQSPLKKPFAYVSDAAASGDTLFNWSARGDVTCSPPAGFSIDHTAARARVLTLKNPRADIEAPPGPNATILAAPAIAAPGSLDCPHPFTDPAVDSEVAPTLPAMRQSFFPGAMVLVKLLIDADGSIVDSWVDAPSGFQDVDHAALAAARESTYKAGTAFCRPAPGEYFFRTDFPATR